MHQALNPKSDGVRIYLSRTEGGRGLISVEDTVKFAILGLERHVLTSAEILLIATRRKDGDYEQHLGMTVSVDIRTNPIKAKKTRLKL